MTFPRRDQSPWQTPIRSVRLLLLVQIVLCVGFGGLLWLVYLVLARWNDFGYWTGQGWRGDILPQLLYRTPGGDAVAARAETTGAIDQAGDAIGQAVPAVVIAMFVFGVGTAFVVAQVVPPGRGARAVQVLQGRRFGATISPALTLLAGSAVLLTVPPARFIDLRSFSITLMVGSVVYVLAATSALLSIYRDATNPESFRRLLEHKARSVLSRWPRRRWWLTRQRRVDHLYGLVRTIRGWTRTSVTTGDSRELNEALTCLINVTSKYAESRVSEHDRRGQRQPSEYRRAAGAAHHRRHRWVANAGKIPSGAAWAAWSSLAREGASADLVAGTWFANEVGRSLVRSAEYGLQTQNLLDRDLLRLMNTMAICSRKFSAMRATDPLVQKSCVWVFVRCFVEIGCQARTFPELPEDWFYSPAIHLLHLHDDNLDRDVRIACEAGLLLVVAAILSRRDPAGDLEADAEAIGNLLRGHPPIDHVKRQGRRSMWIHRSQWDLQEVRDLASTSLLWPEGRPLVSVVDAQQLTRIHEGLQRGIVGTRSPALGFISRAFKQAASLARRP